MGGNTWVWVGPNGWPVIGWSLVGLGIFWWWYRSEKQLPFVPSWLTFWRRWSFTTGAAPVGFDELPAAPREIAREIVVKPMYQSPIVSGWMQDVRQVLHLLVIGHSGGGKTSLIHALAVAYAAEKHRVIVCDPDAAPGLWSACDVYGNGDNFSAITLALHGIKTEVAKRRDLRGQGARRSFEPIYVVIDEYQDVVNKCEGARALVEDILRRGRKLDIHLIIGVQDKAVKTMNFEGQGDLRRNFSWIIEVRKTGDNLRTARLSDPNDDTKTVTHIVPRLPDLDKLVEEAGPVVSSVSAQTPDADRVLKEALGIVPEPYSGVPKNGQGTSSIAGTTSGSSDGLLDTIELEPLIRRMADLNMSRNQMASIIGGNRQRALDKIRAVLGENA
jgi:energy-coupling factor transporter ATP-binding protein EcfA2